MISRSRLCPATSIRRSASSDRSSGACRRGSISRSFPTPGRRDSPILAIVSVAGIDMREFLFKGFPPHKKGRQTFFQSVAASEVPVVYYESPHRVLKNLELLETFAPEKHIILGRELTKMFEEVRRGSIADILAYYRENDGKIK